MKKTLIILSIFAVLAIVGFLNAQPNNPLVPVKELPIAEDTPDQVVWFPFNGQWLPDQDASLIGAKNYKTLKNLRYTDTALEGVNGYSKINTTVLSTYLKIRNGFHFKKDQPAESHVLVQAYNTGLTASQVLENETAIPSQGDFNGTALHTDASGAGVGRFSMGPSGTVIYCNGVESKIWGGDESRVGAFITSTAAITNSITNPKDYTEKVNNTLDDEDQLALIGGGNDSTTQVLLHMDGSDEGTTITDSSTDADHTGTAGGNANTETDQAVFGSASAQFDGTGDYISMADGADFNFGTGTLTIDFRIRFSAVTGIDVLYLQKDATVGDHIALWQDHEEGQLHFQVIDTSAEVINEDCAWVPVVDTWYHLAVIRGWGGVADAWAITVDGTAIHTFTDSGTMPNHDQVVLLGGNMGTTYALDYTARHAIAFNNNAAVSATQKYYGDASLYFDGTADYLDSADSADWNVLTTTNVTIDMWVKHTDHVDREGYISQAEDTENLWFFGHEHGTGLLFKAETGNVNIVELSGGEITDTDWHHVAVVKVGTEYGLYLDGAQVAYVDDATTDTYAATLKIGTMLAGTYDFSGYIDNVRLTHDNAFSAAPVAGLSDSISVPTVPHSNSANSKLIVRADAYDLNGYIDEFRIKKASAAWTSTFAIPIRAYGSNALYWVMGSTRPLNGVKLYVENANTNTSATITGTTWNGYSWTSLTNLTDNTSGLEQTGTITFDSTVTVSKPKFLNGYYLYWYQFVLSAGSADLYYATVSAPFQDIIDIWDGVNRQPITFQASRDAVYEDYTLEVNESSYPTVPITATVGDIDNDDFIIIMFDERTTAMEFEILAGHGNATNATTTIYYWDGSAWVAVANLVDGTLDAGATDTLNQTGVISWTPPDIESEFPRELFGVTGYAYKLMFSATLTAGTDYDGTSIDRVYGIPAQLKVPPFEFSALYKNMVMLGGFTQSAQGNRMDFCLPNAPDVWNGTLTSNNAKQSLYFGGDESLTGAVQLYNRFGSNIFATLVAFKNTETYLLTGDSPEDFKIYPLSLNIGCPAPLTIATAEVGYEVAQDAQRNVVIFLSNTGPMMMDGAVFVPIKGVEKYFDVNSTSCINYTYISNARGWYDPTYKEYNLLIPSGSAQQLNNLWLVYDLIRKKWFQKYPGNASMPQAGWQVMSTNGKKYTYGAIDTGYMMRLENGYTWDSTAITQTVETGDFYPSENPWDITRIRRVKLAAQGISEDADVTVTHYNDTETSGTAIATLALDGATGRVTRESQPINATAWTHRFKFETSTSTTLNGLRPTMWGVEYAVVRRDKVPTVPYTETPSFPQVGDSRSKYYVSYLATDQGVDSDDDSLLDICNSQIGATEKATVVFKHWRESTNTTTYTISTDLDLSSYTSITFEIENGALLTVASGKTLTLPSPTSIVASPNQQIFSGAGTVAFSTKGRTPVQWWPATIAGYHAAIEASAGGGVAYFPAGTYTMDSIVGIDTTSDIVIEGDGKDITILDATSSDTLFKGTANLKVRNVNFHDWSIVLDYGSTGGAVNETVDWIEFENCLFTKIAGTAIKWGSPAASAKLERLIVRNCEFSGQGSRNHVHAVSVSCNMDEAWVEGNNFQNLSGRPIVLGASVYAQQDTLQRFFVSNNKIEDIDTGASELISILCYGRDIHITNNTISDLTKDDANTLTEGLEAIYTKARNTVITGNVLRNAGRREGAILVKGNERDGVTSPRGYSQVISDNAIFSDQANSVGILINASETDCHDNVIEGMGYFGININSGEMNNINVHDNIIKNTTGPIGIYDESDGYNINIHDNIIDTIDNSQAVAGDVCGIRSTITAGQTKKNMKLVNNVISNLSNATGDDYGMYLTGGVGSVLDQTTVKGNSFDAMQYGMSIGAPTISDFRLEDNDFDGVTSTVLSTPVAPTGLICQGNRNLDHWTFSLADDAATSFNPPGASGVMIITSENDTTRSGIALWKATGSGATTVKIGGGATFTVSTGALAGTTAADGDVTFSAHTDGSVYIENRSGGVLVISVRAFNTI